MSLSINTLRAVRRATPTVYQLWRPLQLVNGQYSQKKNFRSDRQWFGP
jgi:hypothetical protein